MIKKACLEKWDTYEEINLPDAVLPVPPTFIIHSLTQ